LRFGDKTAAAGGFRGKDYEYTKFFIVVPSGFGAVLCGNLHVIAKERVFICRDDFCAGCHNGCGRRIYCTQI
jgi:hypothetical protein